MRTIFPEKQARDFNEWSNYIKSEIDNYLKQGKRLTNAEATIHALNYFKNKLKFTIEGISKELSVEGSLEKEFFVGNWENIHHGYVTIELQGVSRTADNFGTVSSIGISGTSINSETAFVKDNNDNYFYNRIIIKSR